MRREGKGGVTRRSVLKEARGLDAMEKVNIRFSSKARGELKLREGGRDGGEEGEGRMASRFSVES